MTATTEDMDGMGGMVMDDAADMAATGMAGAGWSLAGFATFVVAWAVMMAAMMFPSAAPMVLLFRTVANQRQKTGGAFMPTWVFIAGYLLVWTAVGALTWALVQGLSHAAGRLGVAERATWAPLALGAVLVGAGLYQLTPLKQVCLDHCRSPFAFVMQHWRKGYGGALRMGLVHGLYCLGCCWALFAVLVAAGVMSLAWMLVLTLVIFAEKVLPGGRRASQVVGVAFLVLGVGVPVGVVDVPGVTKDPSLRFTAMTQSDIKDHVGLATADDHNRVAQPVIGIVRFDLQHKARRLRNCLGDRAESTHLATVPLCQDPRDALAAMAAAQYRGSWTRWDGIGVVAPQVAGAVLATEAAAAAAETVLLVEPIGPPIRACSRRRLR
jgi:predicted metal-binding membrane protein